MIKHFFTGLLTGLLIAFLALFLWPKNTIEVPIVKETFTAEKHPEEISKPVHRVQAQGNKAVFTYEVPTERYGLLKGEVQASRAELQYRHRIGVGGVILSDALLARASYTYKSIEFSFYYGYNFKQKEQRFGAGIGYAFSF